MSTAQDTSASAPPEPSGTGPAAERQTLPLLPLLALATAVFVTSLTETLPAGLLPAMSGDLGVSAAATGQTVTVYALGTALTAIPLTAATAGWGRKRLLLVSMAGFAAANTVTAVSSSYGLTMAARFVAGVAAGLAWALLAGYARRLAPERLQGRAMAVAMAGIPVALSLGVPAGTYLGSVTDWRIAFLAMTGLTVLLLVWIAAAVPDRPGSRTGERPGMLRASKVPGVPAVLFVTLVFVLAHTLLYAYVAAFLGDLGLGDATDLVLLEFGAASLVSIWIVGARIHRQLRLLMVAGTLLVALAAALLGVFAEHTVLVHLAAVLWGLGWGGVPTLLQTAAGEAAGDRADGAQAMLVTLWNVAMAAGGVIGGLLLDTAGSGAFPWTLLALLVPVLVVVLRARVHGFPPGQDRAGA
ncbi:MFS transporter [Streptomyces sp. NPDC058486]|uniref:MFS transporter n=1 Tax=unclassified Streptomyces TaxID=2593676 RepID=UPI00364DB9D1